MEFRAEIRPFMHNVPQFAYELVLIRSDGDKFYDRRLCILNGTDAKDLMIACAHDIKITQAL